MPSAARRRHCTAPRVTRPFGGALQGADLLFTSATFLFGFLPICLGLYFAAPSIRLKNGVLIAASVFFYAWGEPAYSPLIAGLALFNYVAARVVSASAGRLRGAAFVGALAINIAALGVFKYADFVVTSLAPLAAPLGLRVAAPMIPLPLGISFFTFHCLSYLIDIYRGRFPANRRLGEVMLYIAFFPQLIAGPIVRYKDIARRLAMRRHSLGRLSAGLRIFVIGLAQKLLIADALAPLADAVFDKTKAPGALEAWLGTSAYSLQIYFDFAGYSAMAIGLGLIFGFSLPRNFRTPYASASVTEFWRRWHISLSTWFRDYLYVPLGGNRGAAWKTWRNLVVVFLLCGLWHGASWTFVLWGAWHGAFLVAERAGLRRLLDRLPRVVGWLYALTAVWMGWVLFRSADLAHALDIWSAMIGLKGFGTIGAPVALAFKPTLVALLPLAFALSVVAWPRSLRRAWRPVDGVAIMALLAVCLLTVAAGTYSPFLYFRF